MLELLNKVFKKIHTQQEPNSALVSKIMITEKQVLLITVTLVHMN